MLHATILCCRADAMTKAELVDESIHNQINLSAHPHSNTFVTMLDFPSVV